MTNIQCARCAIRAGVCAFIVHVPLCGENWKVLCSACQGGVEDQTWIVDQHHRVFLHNLPPCAIARWSDVLGSFLQTREFCLFALARVCMGIGHAHRVRGLFPRDWRTSNGPNTTRVRTVPVQVRTLNNSVHGWLCGSVAQRNACLARKYSRLRVITHGLAVLWLQHTTRRNWCMVAWQFGRQLFAIVWNKLVCVHHLSHRKWYLVRRTSTENNVHDMATPMWHTVLYHNSSRAYHSTAGAVVCVLLNLVVGCIPACHFFCKAASRDSRHPAFSWNIFSIEIGLLLLIDRLELYYRTIDINTVCLLYVVESTNNYLLLLL